MFAVRQFDARTLSWWADQREDIDFDPPYQRRGGLWSTRDKAFLIDSILNEFDIPKIYIADFTLRPSGLNSKSKRYAVIDGKQRFEAIFDFLDGRIVLDRHFSLASDPSLRLGGLSYRDLQKNHVKIASRFDNFNLTVMSVITDDEAKINELFVRLNRNKPLTGAEIRNAMQGALPGLFRDLADHEFFGTRVRFARARGQDQDVAAKYLLVEFRGRLVETKRASLDRFVEEGIEADSDVSGFLRAADRVRIVLERMKEIFTTRDPLLASQGVAVPYYWLVRNCAYEDQRQIRPFLVHFEESRRANRALASNPATLSQADASLMEYERLSRSINDAGSLEGRYDILLSRFNRWAG